MAKTQIKNYVFKPGIGALDYVYPNAYNLLSRNKSFLLAESIDYINTEIDDAVKCQRDIGYIIDGLRFDIALGTNYNATFLGIAEVNSLDLSNTVVRTIQRTQNQINSITQVAADSTALSRSKTFFNEVIDIIKNGRTAANALSLTNPTGGDANKVAAKDRLLANKDFMAAEVNAWVAENYPGADHDPVKCSRDVKYAINALCYDILYGGNSATYDQAKFFFYGFSSGAPGIDPTHRLQTVAAYNRLQTIVGQIVLGQTVTKSNGGIYLETQNTSGSNATATEATALQTLVQITEDVVAATSQAAALAVLAGISRTLPSITWAAAGIQSAANAISTNKTTVVNAVTWSPTYTYNQEKCRRDLGYVLDAYLYDLRYGGNAETSRVIHYYWDGDVAQVDGNRIPEIDTHAFIGDLITNYILKNVAWSAGGGVAQVVDLTKTAETSYFTPTAAIYNPATGVMTLTIGTHTLEVGDKVLIAEGGLTFTCGLDSNATLHAYPRASGVPNTNKRDPYFNNSIEITAVTSTTITLNIGISSNTSTHTFVSALSNCVVYGAEAKIKTLAQNTVNVITGGLSNLPELEPTGVGTVKVQGNYGTEDILLITNTTKNEIIYNFSNNLTGGSVKVKTTGSETDFVTYLQTTDGVTVITLNYNTASHSSTDELQIFVEGREVRVRPYDFGTDAIERHRIAPPESMLDADFEYGLQPTKWSAIGTMRGYPSVYEIPGTDTEVASVTTDASAGTNGVGASLITVTTVSPHGFTAGIPITIKALEDSVLGAARAEGSFVIVDAPSAITFRYYAKAKVGTTNPQTLSTGYTQLRKAGFYTGSNISRPTISVVTQGTSGTVTTQLGVLSGNDIIPFDGPAPEIGAPLTGTGIVTGSQITAIRDTSAGGGEYITVTLTENITSGDTVINVADTTGVIVGLSVDRGDGFATNVIDVDAVADTITVSNAFNGNFIANVKAYTGVSGTNDTSTGFSATFNISRSGTSYVLDAIAIAGGDYKVGDRILILGSNLGGGTPTNDAIIQVTAVSSIGGITSAQIEGTAFNGTGSVTGVASTPNGGIGSGANFNVDYLNNNYSAVTVSAGGDGYAPNDIIKISGSVINPNNGIDGNNDLIIRVLTVTGSAINTISFSGSAPAFYGQFINQPYTTNGGGSGALFTVTSNAGVYSITITNPGQNFLTTETVTFIGTNIGGLTPANDLTLTITGIDAGGGITSVTLAGTARNGGNLLNLTGTNRLGSGATFNVSFTGGAYTATLANPGTGYGPGQTVKIAGNLLSGSSPANDLTITVSTVDALPAGVITAIGSQTGTAKSAFNTATGQGGSNQANTGSAATFNIVRNFEQYSSIQVNADGNGYKVGNRIVISGSDLDGGSPNNILITIDSVNGSGGINTFTSAYTTAIRGSDIIFVSSFTITEAVTQNILPNTSLSFAALATLQVSFANAHGLVPGDTFIVTVSSDDGINNHSLASGSFLATNIPDVNSLRYQARAVGAITTTTPINSIVYPRPDSFFIHRPFDGGVQLGTGGPQHGAQAIRQSKKYIRYQSGKGIMYTTGALFAPSYDLRSVTADGIEVNSLITVETDDNDHGVQVGGVIRLLGIRTPGYNSGEETGTPPEFDYTVVDIVDERTFKVRAQRRLGATTAILGFGAQMSVVSWHGATVRSGIFDDQNGIFWEYDGTQISVVQRTGTRQISGTVAIQVDSNLVNGTNTKFRDQIKAGDRIIIKGMTHVVSHVVDNSTMYVTPDFRGVRNVTGAKINLIVDKKVKQSEFNLDKLDGTGSSNYKIDPAKMQMIGIQYSWYGAGFIDFMLRGSNGNFVFAHRMRNSNVNTEAFMRSGNLPVRYEVTNEGPSGRLAVSMNSSQTTLTLEDASFFPASGTIYIDNEIINFEGKNGNDLINLTRAGNLVNFNAGAERTYQAGAAESHSAGTGVILISNTITPLISHWGSAFLTDGGFDEDRGYLFGYTATAVPVSTTKVTAFLIRLAPSVSNAIVGDLGERELLNRAQLLLQSLEITSDATTGGGTPTTITGGIVVEGVLNPGNYPLNPGDVIWTGLSSLAQGGQPSFAQIAPGGSINWSFGNQTTATATVLNVVNGNLTVPTGTVYNRPSGTTFSYVTQSAWTALGAEVGFTVNDAKFPAGTTIISLTNSPSPQATIASSTSRSAQVYNGSGSQNYNSFSTNVVRFSAGSWSQMVNPANTIGMRPTYGFASGTVVTAVSGPFGTNPNSYYDVTFSNINNNFIGANFNITFQMGGNRQSNRFEFTTASWNAVPVDVNQTGAQTNDTGKFTAGTTISSITSITFNGISFVQVLFSTTSITTLFSNTNVTFAHTPYYQVNFSRGSTQAINTAATIQLTLSPSTSNTNSARFTQTSWETLVTNNQIGSGTEVSDAKFPANTRVSTVSGLRTFAATNYYLVTFNQTSVTAPTAGQTVTFRFGQPPYALPGETVFSFIANPGERSTLDLSSLKELTNTPLGGRGTFPNGPDVLAINIYKASGQAGTANVILRWGEAQA